MNRSIVTGGAGFIGSALVRALLAQGRRVHVIDNLSTGKLDNLEEIADQITVHEFDLRDYDRSRPLSLVLIGYSISALSRPFPNLFWSRSRVMRAILMARLMFFVRLLRARRAV